MSQWSHTFWDPMVGPRDRSDELSHQRFHPADKSRPKSEAATRCHRTPSGKPPDPGRPGHSSVNTNTVHGKGREQMKKIEQNVDIPGPWVQDALLPISDQASFLDI